MAENALIVGVDCTHKVVELAAEYRSKGINVILASKYSRIEDCTFMLYDTKESPATLHLVGNFVTQNIKLSHVDIVEAENVDTNTRLSFIGAEWELSKSFFGNVLSRFYLLLYLDMYSILAPGCKITLRSSGDGLCDATLDQMRRIKSEFEKYRSTPDVEILVL